MESLLRKYQTFLSSFRLQFKNSLPIFMDFSFYFKTRNPDNLRFNSLQTFTSENEAHKHLYFGNDSVWAPSRCRNLRYCLRESNRWILVFALCLIIEVSLCTKKVHSIKSVCAFHWIWISFSIEKMNMLSKLELTVLICRHSFTHNAFCAKICFGHIWKPQNDIRQYCDGIQLSDIVWVRRFSYAE